MKIKKDRYFRERGGTAKIISVLCAKCNSLIFTYQKDGPGWLKRGYFNRIISPEKYAQLQYSTKKEPKDFGNLICECGEIIGSPTKYKDGRLAFHLIRGNFKRINDKLLTKKFTS